MNFGNQDVIRTLSEACLALLNTKSGLDRTARSLSDLPLQLPLTVAHYHGN